MGHGGKPCDPVHGVAAKSLLGHREWLQQAWGGLCTVLSMLTDLTLTANYLTTVLHMGPPYPRRQELVHLFGPKVGCQHATVGFIQQQLPTGCRYHQPSSSLGATKDQLSCNSHAIPMQFPCNSHEIPKYES